MSSIEVSNLRVTLVGSGVDVADGITFSIAPGEVLGLVGESGSGKTTVGTALLGYARRGAKIAGGSVRINDTDILSVAPDTLRALRGKRVAYVPQDPATALNPSLRIGQQLEELLEIHEPELRVEQRKGRLLRALEEVNLTGGEETLNRFPHQLSGGQQQRVCLAMAFLLRPTLIVLDEPTTGLDVITQAHVLETARDLCRSHRAAALYVTHDLAVIANLADRILVMYAGRLAELGPTSDVFQKTAHPYTLKLIAAIPEIEQRRTLSTIPGHAPSPGARGQGCLFEPRCPMAIRACQAVDPPAVEIATGHISRCHRAREVLTSTQQLSATDAARRPVCDESILSVKGVGAFYGQVQVVHDVSFDLGRRECLALVGGSGSGKTTLARSIIGLMGNRSGEIRLNGELLATQARQRTADQRRLLQYVFQNPYSSLNPRKSIAQSIELPLRQFFGAAGADARNRAAAALERVSLPQRVLNQYPDQLSGGERQRVAIARALVCQPHVLVCDEITSALDVSVQAAIINLLQELQYTGELSILFITHNLALVRSLADRVIVMHEGRIVESGDTDTVLDHPSEDYTRRLRADTPSLRAKSMAR